MNLTNSFIKQCLREGRTPETQRLGSNSAGKAVQLDRKLKRGQQMPWHQRRTVSWALLTEAKPADEGSDYTPLLTIH